MMNGPEYTLPIDIPGIKYFKDKRPFKLELRGTLENGIVVAYHT